VHGPLVVLIAAVVAAGNPLQVLEGHWHAHGRTLATPFSTAGQWTGTWMCSASGPGFMVCPQQIDGPAVSDIAVYSYDERTGILRYTEIDPKRSSVEQLAIRDGVWYYTDPPRQTRRHGTPRFRTTNRFDSAGRETFRVEYSRNGTTWHLMGDGEATRDTTTQN